MGSSVSIIIGITGGIACGKSEAGRVLSAEGFKVLDCDVLAHELMSSGRPVYSRVVAQFGKDILADDGEIDRRKLGTRVFKNPDELTALNRMVHPAVLTAAKEWVAACRAADEDAAVLVPLLFEVNWTDGWDATVCIIAPENQAVEQLQHQRGFNEDEARRRMAAQMPLDEKAAKSDFVIWNDSTLESFRNKMIDLAECVRSRKKREQP
ncbi:MAG: dephospho-CoA kinase [Kiritimatiellales bacterium]